MEFKETVLSDIAKINMGQSPKSEFYNDVSGFPFLQGNRTFGHLYPVIDTFTEKVTKKANVGDILMSVRAPVGDLNIAPVNLCIGRGLCSISVDESLRSFVYYLLKNEIKNLENQSTGTIFSSVNRKTLENLKVNVPTKISDQKNIGDFLWSLDEKIDLNNKTIANLEELSKTLFKRWFVDFEFPNEEGNPYRSSNRDLIDSSLGQIPKEWNILNLSDICEVRDGTHDSPKQRTEGFPLVTSKHLKFYQLDLDDAKLISEEDYLKVNQRSKVHKHDILISMIGTIGRMYYVLEDEISYAIKNIGLIKSSQFDYPNFIYLTFKTPQIENHIRTHSAGSTQQYISLTELRKIPILLPANDVLMQFDLVTSPIFLKIRNLIEEIEDLVLLRDTLLPKLMSGEIELPDDMEVEKHAKLLQ